jgi:uncharacterized membrane protein YidH (DUF202 family)
VEDIAVVGGGLDPSSSSSSSSDPFFGDYLNVVRANCIIASERTYLAFVRTSLAIVLLSAYFIYKKDWDAVSSSPLKWLGFLTCTAFLLAGFSLFVHGYRHFHEVNAYILQQPATSSLPSGGRFSFQDNYGVKSVTNPFSLSHEKEQEKQWPQALFSMSFLVQTVAVLMALTGLVILL